MAKIVLKNLVETPSRYFRTTFAGNFLYDMIFYNPRFDDNLEGTILQSSVFALGFLFYDRVIRKMNMDGLKAFELGTAAFAGSMGGQTLCYVLRQVF